MDSFRGRSRWLSVGLALVFVYTLVEDVQRDAWVHIAAVVVLAASYSQPQLTPRRRALELLAFAMFEVSMAVAIRGIAEDRGRGAAIAAIVFWIAISAFIAVGYIRYQRHLRTRVAAAESERSTEPDVPTSGA